MAQVVVPVLLALDIGSKKHHVAWECGDRCGREVVENTPSAMRRLFSRLIERFGELRIVMEATGVYFFDAALMATELGAQVMVVNPKTSHNFAKALAQRNKTDKLDALMLLEFLKRMPFRAWVVPSQAGLEIRHYGRYLLRLVEESTAAKNRLHALQSGPSPRALRVDLKRSISSLDKRIDRLRTEAVTLIASDPDLKPRFDALLTIKGIGKNSAISLLGELIILPPEMTSRACVSHAGLDVLVHQSGDTSKPPRISRHGNKYLRGALFMPSLSQCVHDPHVRAFKQTLLDRGKKKMQAQVAIMRKTLTVAWALFRNPGVYDGNKLYNTNITTT